MPFAQTITLKRARASALAALCIAPTLATAQETPLADDEGNPVELEPVVVTASRFDTDISVIPSSVSLIDKSYIDSSAATSVADLLDDVGVLMRSYTGNPAQSQIDMRGYGESGNQNVLVLVDGRRINAPDMSGINWLNMPLASVDKIEVLRGSQSALYGNNAGGGVIKITTYIPDAPGGAAITGYGSWQSWLFRAATWTPITDSIRARAEIGYVESDGYRDNSGYKTRTANLSLQGGKGRVTWTAIAGFDDNYFQYPGPLGTAMYKKDPRASGYHPMEADYWGESANSYIGGSLGWKDDAIELKADLNGSHRDMSWDMGAGFDAESTLDTWTLSPRVKYSWDNGISTILGVDGEYDYLFLERFSDLAHSNKVAHARLKRHTGGVYLNSSWTGSGPRPLTIEATTRVQSHALDAGIIDDASAKAPDENDKSGTDSAFSLGSTWQATKTHRLWIRGDRFFRYPAIDEVVAYQGYKLTVPFNAKLESERGWGAEAGLDWALPHALFRVNAFAQDVEGLIAFDYTDNLNVNLADATRVGVETSVQAAVGDWKFGAFHTFVRVRFTDGKYEDKELYLVPHHQANAYVEWAPGRFSLRLNGRYVGKSWEGNDFANVKGRMPDYFVADVVARYRIGESWHVFAAVENALDRKYASLRYSGMWYPAAARSYRAGVQWQY